ncbi:MAG TPA: PDZ domain-containing protein [Sphingobacteriaceae bacterium]|nr:PDZ domain-containing protein [Sphingobacteriaceae bacterium]
MAFFLELTRSILAVIPQILFQPGYALFFWLLMLLLAMQYRRVHQLEVRLYGRAREPIWRGLLTALGYGLLGGVAGSYLLVLTGVTVGRNDIAYLWPLALLLMLVHPRFVCFSYAGGLVSLSYLIFGWPQVNVAGLVGLVAILHIVEGVLVYFSGEYQATPVYVRHGTGQVVGGFSLQRFWPVPIVILLMMSVPPGLQGEAIEMPAWWPLIAPATDDPSLVPVMWPVMAALGYGDLALTRSPGEKRRRTALHLVLYSLTLLVLAVAASRWTPLLWVAALASPGLHELMIQVGLQGEMQGRPLYRHPARGVMLLDVWPGGYGAAMGLAQGDIILSVNGQPVNSRHEFEQALLASSWYLELTGERDGELFRVDTNRFRYGPGAMGVVLVPGPGDPPHVEIQRAGFLARVLGRWLRFPRRQI